MKHAEELQLLEQVGKIYDAALDLNQWPAMLEGLVDRFKTSMVVTVLIDEDRPTMGFIQQIGTDETYLNSYQEYYGVMDPSGVYTHDYPVGRIHLSHETWAMTDFKKSEFYHDWARPQGTYHVAFGFPVKDGSKLFALSVQRPAGPGQFTEADRQYLNALMPHLRRA